MRPSPHVMYHAVRTAVFSIPGRFLLLSWSGDLWHMTASITLLLKVLQWLDWPRACYTSERVVTQTQTVTALETTNHPNNKARRPAAIVTSDSKQERLGLLLIRLVRTKCLIPVHLFRNVVFVGFQLLWSENECEQLLTLRRFFFLKKKRLRVAGALCFHSGNLCSWLTVYLQSSTLCRTKVACPPQLDELCLM